LSHKFETSFSSVPKIKKDNFERYPEVVKTILAVNFDERKKVNRKSKEVPAQETSKH